MDINELLSEPKGKSKKGQKGYDFSNDYENKKKIKCNYNFDKLSSFKLFTINNKTVFSKEIEEDFNLQAQEKILDKIDEGIEVIEGEGNEGEFANDMNGFEGGDTNKNTNSFLNDEKEIERNFGRLYRRFDIRSLKNKIWNNYESFYPNDQVDFKNVVTNMSKDMTEDELYSISTPTCFVCMLHLCNENNLYINQKDSSTFFIEKDINGEKTALSSKTKSNDITKAKHRKNKKKEIEDEMIIDD